MGSIDSSSAVAQVMVWGQAITWSDDDLIHWCIYAPQDLNGAYQLCDMYMYNKL